MKAVNKILSTPIYIYPRIRTCSTKTTRIIVSPTIKYFHKYMVEHVIMSVTTTNSTLDRRLDGHVLPTHTYLDVGTTLHKNKLATYMAISYMKATSNI
jgi:hypothetical protein